MILLAMLIICSLQAASGQLLHNPTDPKLRKFLQPKAGNGASKQRNVRLPDLAPSGKFVSFVAGYFRLLLTLPPPLKVFFRGSNHC